MSLHSGLSPRLVAEEQRRDAMAMSPKDGASASLGAHAISQASHLTAQAQQEEGRFEFAKAAEPNRREHRSRGGRGRRKPSSSR